VNATWATVGFQRIDPRRSDSGVAGAVAPPRVSTARLITCTLRPANLRSHGRLDPLARAWAVGDQKVRGE
jgi:hypothetical protein